MSAEAYLGLDNAGFRTGLAEAKQAMAEFKQEASKALGDGELLDGFVEDVGAAKSGFDVLSSSAERFSSLFEKLAGGGIAVAIGLGLKKGLEEASGAASKIFDTFNDISSVNLGAATDQALQDVQSKAEQLAEQAGETGFFGRILFGKGIDAAVNQAQQIAEKAKSEAEKRAIARSEVETARSSAVNPDEAAEAERQAIRLEYVQRIAEAQYNGNKALAEQLALEEKAKLNALERAESNRKNAEITAKGAKAVADALKLEEAQAARTKAENDEKFQLATPQKKLEILNAEIRAQEFLAQAAADPVEREKAGLKVVELRGQKREVEADIQKEAKRVQDEADQKADRTEKKREQNALALMNTEEKRAYLKNKFDREKDPEKKQELAGQLIGLAGSQAAVPVDSLRQIGLSAGNANYGYDGAKQTNDYLKDIREYVKKTAEKEEGTDGEAQFGGG